MDDVVDFEMNEEENEGEVDKAYQEICDEIGIEMRDRMGTASSNQMEQDLEVTFIHANR